MSDIKISMLLPTRGRTEILKRSLLSLADLADRPEQIEMLLAFDHDDQETYDWFEQNVAPELDQKNIAYTCYGFERLGYIRLNEYLNELCKHAQGDWLMFWGDDAVMKTQGWDKHITAVKKFRVLRMPTHNCHPYAIFPIVPKKWFEIFGYMSPHQLTDSWVSQVGYIANVMHNIAVAVDHDRFDITGNNNDTTYQNRPMLEGNPWDPRDFNHQSWHRKRFDDAGKIAHYLESQGEDVSWYRNVMNGTQDPWEKQTSPENDPNKQVTKITPSLLNTGLSI